MEQKVKICARFDASQALGGGHAIRSLCLLEQIQTDHNFKSEDITLLVNPEAHHTLSVFNGRAYRVHVIPPNNDDIDSFQYHISGCRLFLLDHYNWDIIKETRARGWADNIFVIDDLANRQHECDFLLDQTLGRRRADYLNLTPRHTQCYLGPKWSLTRPQFEHHRAKSLHRRSLISQVEHVLISAGLTDPANATSLYLETLKYMNFTGKCTVLLGEQSPHYQHVRAMVESYSFPILLHCNVKEMAALMTEVDFALGTAGSSVWERCVMGLPSATVVVAENQAMISRNVEATGAGIDLGPVEHFLARDAALTLKNVFNNQHILFHMAEKAATLCKGEGPQKISLDIGGAIST